MSYASRKLFKHLTRREFSQPWTYVYREWREDGKRCAECVAVDILREDGTTLRVTMADMLAESQQIHRLPYADSP